MDIDSQEQSAERAELHFLAALVDELMKSLHTSGVVSRDQLQRIEQAAVSHTGTAPRAW